MLDVVVFVSVILTMPAFFASITGGWRMVREVYQFFAIEFFLKPLLWPLGVRW